MDQHVKQRKETVSFRVDGTVKTNERHRHGQGRIWTPAKTTAARREIVEAFYEASGRDWEPWEGPVELYVSCRHQTPKSGWTGKQCNRKPDLDNVLKLVGDALNGVAYRDDAQISSCAADKRYSDAPGVLIHLDFMRVPQKPKSGRLKVGPTEWEVWDSGLFLGKISRLGARYVASFGLCPAEYFRTLIEAGAWIRSGHEKTEDER